MLLVLPVELSPHWLREKFVLRAMKVDIGEKNITGGINLAWVIKMSVSTALHQRSEDLGNPGIDLTLGHFPTREAGS